MMRRCGQALSCGLAAVLAGAVSAAPPPPAAAPDLPHPYYYREMYLPQLTSGPSSVAWAPDSRAVVYSMAGTLWRQAADTTVAVQLTDGPGYDYQPDWSPDGRCLVYVSAPPAGTALELKLLDLESGAVSQLTHGGAVNVEPRFSPDGRRIVFVSSAYHGHFHLFVAELEGSGLREPVRFTDEHRSLLPRYYYSPYDHEINPAWTRDGQSILFVSNRGHIHGTGGLWRMPAVAGAEPVELHDEETNWEARPDVSPDGRRLIYSSYLGRNWLQLWLMPSGGGDALPLTYGDWDDTAARWSPDGRQIAFISNREGNTQLRLLRFPGGDSRVLDVTERRWLRPHGRLHLSIRDEHGAPTAARVTVTDAARRFYGPASAWLHHAEFDRNAHPFEARYFHSAGDELIELPAGTVSVEVMKGLTRPPVLRSVAVTAGETAAVSVVLPAQFWPDASAQRWVSGDVHVHMNYGGHYRNTPAHLALQAQAEDLDIVENLVVNKEQRIPDIAWSGRGVDPASTPATLIVHGQEFHTSYWGHLGILGLRGGVLLPGYAGYPNTAAASLAPMNAEVADLAHARGALVGYVHPFEQEPRPLTQPVHTDADELPVDVALGKVDYLEIVSFADHQASASVWYRLLNLGFRIPAAAGTDAMADYATLRGPVGLNRVYASIADGALDHGAWLESLRQGRTFATNGPLLGFSLGAGPIGSTLRLERGQEVAFSARLRSIVPVEHAQIVCNGRSVRELPLRGRRQELAVSGTLPLARSGWCLLRAFTAAAEYPILDNFVYATTGPIYVSIHGEKPRSPEDAQYFEAWIDHLIETTTAYPDWNSPDEKAAVLGRLAAARRIYRGLE
jgi:hypothetical protein